MSRKSFIEFLLLLKSDQAKFAAYDARNLAQFQFHAQNEGFLFTKADVDQVIGQLEFQAISAKDADQFGADSALWRDMWGRRRVDYLINRLLPRFTADELAALGSEDSEDAEDAEEWS
jgi:hypothetical protein